MGDDLFGVSVPGISAVVHRPPKQYHHLATCMGGNDSVVTHNVV